MQDIILSSVGDDDLERSYVNPLLLGLVHGEPPIGTQEHGPSVTTDPPGPFAARSADGKP